MALLEALQRTTYTEMILVLLKNNPKMVKQVKLELMTPAPSSIPRLFPTIVKSQIWFFFKWLCVVLLEISTGIEPEARETLNRSIY